jgi:hypothetical protein
MRAGYPFDALPFWSTPNDLPDVTAANADIAQLVIAELLKPPFVAMHAPGVAQRAQQQRGHCRQEPTFTGARIAIAGMSLETTGFAENDLRHERLLCQALVCSFNGLNLAQTSDKNWQ